MVYEEENAELIQIGVIFLYINGILEVVFLLSVLAHPMLGV